MTPTLQPDELADLTRYKRLVMPTVPIKKAAEMTGYSVKAIERKIERGVWREGIEWRKAPDGRRHIILEAVQRWAESA